MGPVVPPESERRKAARVYFEPLRVRVRGAREGILVDLSNGGALVLRGTRFVPPPKGPAPSLASTLAQVAGSLEDHFRLQRKTWPLPLLKRMRLLGKRVSGTASSERVGVGTQHFDRSHARMAMSRLSHVVLRSQDFRGIVEKRRRNYLQLLDRLRDVTPPIFLELPPGLCPLSYSIRVRDKQAVVERLAARGVEAVNFWSQHHPALPAGRCRSTRRRPGPRAAPGRVAGCWWPPIPATTRSIRAGRTRRTSPCRL